MREGDTIAAILENNAHIHAVMWAARRSGLYYALINTTSHGSEAAYIVENSRRPGGDRLADDPDGVRRACGATARRSPKMLLIADEDLEGWQRYPECVADQPSEPIADETR